MSTLPERDPLSPAEKQGLFRKFEVSRVDGSDAPGYKHHGCEYFVLDVDHDPYARAALIAYALACGGTHPQLAADLLARHAPGIEHDSPAGKMVLDTFRFSLDYIQSLGESDGATPR